MGARSAHARGVWCRSACSGAGPYGRAGSGATSKEPLSLHLRNQIGALAYIQPIKQAHSFCEQVYSFVSNVFDSRCVISNYFYIINTKKHSSREFSGEKSKAMAFVPAITFPSTGKDSYSSGALIHWTLPCITAIHYMPIGNCYNTTGDNPWVVVPCCLRANSRSRSTSPIDGRRTPSEARHFSAIPTNVSRDD